MFRIFIWIIFTTCFALSYPLTTEGPRGETPVPSSFISLRVDEIAEIKNDSLTLAIVFHDTSSEFSQVVINSIRTEAKKLNVTIPLITCSGFSIDRQRELYQSAVLLSPDLMITLALSPTETTELRSLIDNGTSISFLSNLPDSLNFPDDYASVITDDLFGMGKAMADLIARESGDSARLLYIYHDAEYYVTNQRDQSFRNVLELAYPSIEIIDSIGVTSADDMSEQLKDILEMRSSEIDVIYTPWATIAESALPLIEKSESCIDLYTIDLSSTLFREMIVENCVKGFVSDLPQELGRALLVSAILHHYKEETPAFSIVPAIQVNKINGVSQWKEIMGTEFEWSIDE